MFDAGRGFFYLVFANEDDYFFTDAFIRLNFLSYLKLRLIEDEYRQLCFIGKTSFTDELDYKMDFIGALSKELIGFFKRKRRTAPGRKKRLTYQVISESRLHCESDYLLMKESLLKLTDLMDDNRDIAVVCPIDIFAECCKSDAFVKKLSARQTRANHNVMILTGSVDANENDRYFRNPAFAYPDSVPPLVSEVFFDEKLFPNMAGKYNDSFTNTPKLVLTYEALKDAFAERMIVLNSLNYEKLLIAVKYSLMREESAEFRYPPDAYAALLWAWYENDLFRAKYPQLKLPDNPFRSTRVIIDFISERGITPEANAVIQAEKSWYYRDFVNRWFCEDKDVAIVYDKNTLLDSRTGGILREMDTFSRLIEGHEAIFGAEGMRKLAAVRRYFSKPSYTSCHNRFILPHERFFETDNRAVLQEMFQYLKKWEWNTWDDGAALLLATLFELCYRAGTAMSSMDFYNELGEQQFEKTMQSIRFCVSNSKAFPADSARASRFVNEAVNVLRSGDNKKIKQFIVLKGETELYG